MPRCYLCAKKKKESVLYWETPCLDHKYKHAKNCLKEGIHLACVGAVFFDMLSFEALAAAIKYSDYRNPTSIWWFARVSLNFNSKEAETDALTCDMILFHAEPFPGNNGISSFWFGFREIGLENSRLASVPCLRSLPTPNVIPLRTTTFGGLFGILQ